MISRQKYTKELLKRFDTEGSKIIDTPISIVTRLDMDKPGSRANETMYRGIIGSLLYITASRPDIFLYGIVCQEKHFWYGTFFGLVSNLMGHKKTKPSIPFNCLGGVSSSCLLLCSTVVDQVTAQRFQDNVDKGLICMKFYSTEDQIADIFTKALSKEHIEKNRMAL
nr:uncharacterized protein LOC117273504 [Nicotiana tomentosiformis]